MRKHVLAALTLLAFLGTAAAQTPPKSEWYMTRAARSASPPVRLVLGVTPGMTGSQATSITGETNARNVTTHNAPALLKRTIPLAAWRGQRVRISLRLKPEGNVYGWTMLSLANSDRSGLSSFRRRTDFGGGEWESIPFVLDIPRNADSLYVDVGLAGEGRVWVDEVRLEAAGSDADLSTTHRVSAAALGRDPCCSAWGFTGDAYPDSGPNPYNPYAGWAQSTLTDMRNSAAH